MTPHGTKGALTVAMNLLFLGEQAGGIGRYARELIGAILTVEPATRLSCIVARDAPADLRDEPWAGEVRFVRAPLAMGSRPPLHVAFQLAGLPGAVREADVVHSPANIGPLRSPRVPAVLTLHDLVWIHHPGDWEDARSAARMRQVAVRSARRADRVIAISRAAGEDFAQTIQLDPARVDVVPHGVRAQPTAAPTPEAELRARLGLGAGPVVLCVSQKRPYKNQEALVRALPELGDAVLVCPGAPTPYEARLRELAGELGVGDRVVLPGWVSEAELEGLYRAATCFALPTLFEGFGLPVLEAMARGVPVASSNVWSLPEVAGGAALLFDPRDQAAVTTAVRRLLTDPELAARLSVQGRERAREHSWERTAHGTLASYRRAIASRTAATAGFNRREGS